MHDTPGVPLASTRRDAIGSGTVVATLRLPLPIGQDLVEATAALERVYGTTLFLLPTEPGDEFVRIGTGE